MTAVRRILAVLVVALVAGACRTASPPPVSRLDLRARHRVHVVAAGESAWAIARRYEVPLADLVALNELEDPSRLHPGDELLIPGPRPPGAPPPPPTTPTEPDLAPTPVAASVGACRDVTPWLAPPEDVGRSGFSWPVDGVVILKYGKKDGLPHEGIDVAAPVGTPVRAAADGEVIFSGEQGGYGNLVVVRHPKGRTSVYAHHHENCVKAGQTVARGEPVGLVGQTGGIASPYLYFEVREGKGTINPRAVLP